MDSPFDRLKLLLKDLAKVSLLGFSGLTVAIFTALLAILAFLTILYRTFLGTYF